MSEKLCSCPFCGSEPRIYETQWAIKCGDPHCSVKPSVYSNDRDVAVTRWNTRTTDSGTVDTETGEVRNVD